MGFASRGAGRLRRARSRPSGCGAAESEEKREPASDIDTGVVDSLKVLDPDGRLEKRPFKTWVLRQKAFVDHTVCDTTIG